MFCSLGTTHGGTSRLNLPGISLFHSHATKAESGKTAEERSVCAIEGNLRLSIRTVGTRGICGAAVARHRDESFVNVASVRDVRQNNDNASRSVQCQFCCTYAPVLQNEPLRFQSCDPSVVRAFIRTRTLMNFKSSRWDCPPKMRRKKTMADIPLLLLRCCCCCCC